eukprot:6394583-Alexandrium_andersonii.AAC.1
MRPARRRLGMKEVGAVSTSAQPLLGRGLPRRAAPPSCRKKSSPALGCAGPRRSSRTGGPTGGSAGARRR